MSEANHLANESHIAPCFPNDKCIYSSFVSPFPQFNNSTVDVTNEYSNLITGSYGQMQEYPIQGSSTKLAQVTGAHNSGDYTAQNIGSWKEGVREMSVTPSDVSSEDESQQPYPGFTHDHVDGLSMVGNNSAATDKGRSVVGKLQSKINSLPTNVDGLSTTLGKISSAVNDMSTVIETLSSKVGSTSMAVDSLSAKTDSISNAIGKLSETMGEIVKRERMAMEKFGNLSSRMG